MHKIEILFYYFMNDIITDIANKLNYNMNSTSYLENFAKLYLDYGFHGTRNEFTEENDSRKFKIDRPNG